MSWEIFTALCSAIGFLAGVLAALLTERTRRAERLATVESALRHVIDDQKAHRLHTRQLHDLRVRVARMEPILSAIGKKIGVI